MRSLRQDAERGDGSNQTRRSRLRRSAAGLLLALIVGLLAACSGNTTAATNVGTTTATFSANVSCSGGSPYACSYYWQWGTGGSYQYSSTVNGPYKTTWSGTVTYSATGLQPGSTYQYQLCGMGDTVSAYVCVGPDGTPNTATYFTTTASAASTPPSFVTGAASSITTSGAVVSGTVYPNGSLTAYGFQYGATTAYGTTAGSSSTSTTQTVQASLTGLSSSTTYHYRLAGYSAAGTTYGADATFTTASGSTSGAQSVGGPGVGGSYGFSGASAYSSPAFQTLIHNRGIQYIRYFAPYDTAGTGNAGQTACVSNSNTSAMNTLTSDLQTRAPTA